MDPECPLCKRLEGKALFRNSVLTLIQDDPPMVILSEHKKRPNPSERRHISSICLEYFPDRVLRRYMKDNQGHWHDYLIL